MELRRIKEKYKDRMLMLAFIVSQWSDRGHGCVLAKEGKYVISTGYTGRDRYGRKAPPVHAEVNALINLKGLRLDAKDTVAYVTKKPCDACFEALTRAGVEAIFWLQGCNSENMLWEEGDKWIPLPKKKEATS